MLGRRAVALGLAALLLPGAAPHEPDDYRTEDYRAPVPATLHGATVLSTEQAHALWLDHRAAWIDVLPLIPRPANLPAGTLWLQRPRADIPGSLWLPDTGYGALAPAMEDYFERGLEAASGGERGRTLVFYCKPDCWMSWNAARRAVSLGWPHVAWYPDGADGWAQAGYPLESRTPEPRPSQ